MRRFTWLATLVAAVLAAACGKPQSGVTPRDRDLLTYDEIVNSARDGLDLYEALQSLRPHFLQPPLGIQRGSAPPGTAVYVDSRRLGGLETLRTILAGNVEEVRYLGPTQSQNELGPTASLGALMVKMRRRGGGTKNHTNTTLEGPAPPP